MKMLTDMLHLLLCQCPHESDMMKVIDRSESKCYYYLECDIAGGDVMPDHLDWLNVVRNFKASLNLNTDEEALEFIKECIRISQSVRELTNDNKGKRDFIMSLLS